ncbi:MAG: DUF5661 family protein [Nitrososphaerales archaeon]
MKVSRADTQLVASILEASLAPTGLQELQWGIETELEHVQTVRKLANKADFIIAGAIALDHLKEDPKYYTKLRRWHATR